MTRLRGALIALAAVVAGAAPAVALAASPACMAVKAGAFDQAATFDNGTIQSSNARLVSGATSLNGIATNNWTGLSDNRWYGGPSARYDFIPGETITVTASGTATQGELHADLYRGLTSNTLGSMIDRLSPNGSFTYTIASTEFAIQSRLVQTTLGSGTISMTATCTAAPPTISTISVIQGPTAGGTVVTLTGSNFTDGTLTVGGAGVTPSSASDTSLTFTTPAHVAGAVAVAVTTEGGTDSRTFTYVAPPTVTAVSPTAGPTSGGTTVTITGTNLSNATAVTFGATAATGFTVNSGTQITATAPANSAGTYDIRVTTVGGTSATSAADQYTYVQAPTVTSISPTAGPTGGGTTVIITGTGFSAASPTGAVKFGATNASYIINSNTQITATSPANSAGTYDVTVTTVGGTSATSAADQFTYIPAPTVTSISPTAGSTTGGTTVTITGTNLSGATAVTFGGTAATGFTVMSGTQISATSPAGTGTVDVRVTTIGGTSAISAADQFTYVPAPTGNSFTYGSIVAYNEGSNQTTPIDVATGGNVQNSPTSYAVGSATTANGGSVSINSAGLATYTPPVGYRNANDSFTYTATNAGGTSAPRTVTVTLGNPTFSVTLPSSSATVERAYNAGSAPITVDGGRAAYTINSISGLPSGLTDAGGGVISGTPTAQGVYTVTVGITDSSTGAGPYTANATATLTVSLPPAPVASSMTGPAVAYNPGGATATTFSVAGNATNLPTSYAVGSATTANGGSVSVDSAGLVSYTPPAGFRGNDSFTFTATNAGGTSSPATVTVPVTNPTFSVTLPAATGTVGVAYNSGASPVTVSGGRAPYSGFSATGLPAGLSMSSSGVISGTPTTATNATVVVTLTDSTTGTGPFTSTASASLSIAPPTITLSPAAGALPGAQAGVAYSQTFTSTGGYAPVVYYVGTGSTPPGTTVAANGILSGTPTAAGTFNFTVIAQDSSGNAYTGSAAYSVTVNPPAISLDPTLPNATVGASYSATVTASGGNAPYSFAVTSGPLPAGLTLSATGDLTGTPTEGGLFPITITATDSTTGGTYTGSQSYTLNVMGPAISLSPGALPNATVGASGYSQTVTASGGTAGYTYAITAGSLPPGMSLSTGGVITGTPTGGGTYNFTITTTDSSGGAGPYTGSAAYSLTAAAATITVSPSALTPAAVGAAVNETFSASGGTSGYSYAVTAGALPAGTTLSMTGDLTGTPTAAGTFNFTVTTTDSSTGTGAPYTGSRAYAWTVGAATITVNPASLSNGRIGQAYSQTVTGSGGVPPYSYGLTGALPAGLTLNSATGVISGTPTQAGTFNVTVTATDSATGVGAPFMGNRNYTITINNPTLTMTPSTLTGMTVAQPFSATITAGGGTAPWNYFMYGGTVLPAGLSLASNGDITGTPTAAGSFSFTIAATDSSTGVGAPFTVARAYNVTVGAPTLNMTPADLPEATQHTAYSETLTTTGGTTPYTYSLTGALPAGITLSAGGVLSGTPTVLGTYNFTVRVTDSTTGTGPYFVDKAYTLVVNVPSPPTVGTVTETVAANGDDYTVTPNLSGAPATSVAIVAQPTHGTVTISGLSFRYTPTAGYSGTDSFTYTATNAGGTSAPTTATITVTPPTLVLTDVTPASADALVAYSATVTASAGTAPYSFTLDAGALPAGVTVANGGVVSGTPTQSGTFTFTIRATDTYGATGTRSYNLAIAAPMVTLTPATLPAGVSALAYSETVTASGAAAPYSYAVTAGALPTGLTLSAAGVVSGVPGAAGSFNFTITATDAHGFTGTQAYTVAIDDPVITVTAPAAGALPAGVGGTAYSQTFTATGGQGTHSFALASGTLPAGLTLSTAGVLSGTPTQAGTFSFTVRATDASPAPGPFASASVGYSLTITAPTIALTPAGLPDGVSAVNYNQVLTAAGGTGPYSYAVTAGAAPTGLTLSSAGVLSGVAGAAGIFNFTVTATDAHGFTGAQAYTVTVEDPVITVTAPAAGALPAGQGGTAYSQTFTASGGQGTHTFALASGTLPTGLSLSTAGVLSGTPTQAGSFSFTVTATDASPAPGPFVSAAASYTLDIAAPTIVLTPAAGALPGGLRTVAYSQTISATGGTAPYDYAVTTGTLPAGLTLSTAGALSGTPTTAGSYGFTVTATDAYGFTQSAAYTLEVGTPIAVVQPRTVTVVGGQSVTIDAAEGAVGLDLASAQVATAPAHGTTSVNGLVITYTANGAYSGPDSFTYTVTNPGGVSAPATVTITVNPAVRPGPDKTATVLAGQTAVVELTEGAFGAPFTGAAVVSVSPSNAGVATISGRVAGGVQLYDLHFEPDNAFVGDAVVLYTLSNAFTTSAPGKVTITVEERPDPAQDPEVSGLITAQGEAARRFASAQMANVNRRLEQLHDGRDGAGFSSGLSLSFGGSLGGGMANDPSELRRMQDGMGVMGGVLGRASGLGGIGGGDALGFDQGVPAERRAEDLRTGSDIQDPKGPWGVWVSGAATFGRIDEGLDREGFKFNTDGLTIGVDRRLGEKFVLGGAVGWATDSSKIGSNGTRSEADAWSVSLYGSVQPTEKAFIDLVLGYGKLDFDSKRYVTANGDFAYGQRDGDQWFGSVTAGWDYRHPQGLHLTPYGRIEASRSTLGAFTEEGGGLYALAYDEQTTETLTGALGLRGDYEIKTRFGRAIPSFRIEYAYDLQGSGTQRIRYADWLDGNVYALDVSDLDRNRMLYGLGIELMRASGTRFGLDYEGLLSGDETSGTLRLKLQTRF